MTPAPDDVQIAEKIMSIVRQNSHDVSVREIATMLRAHARRARDDEREACAKIAETQPYFHDTHTGTRQQWVKDQIAQRIRAALAALPLDETTTEAK